MHKIADQEYKTQQLASRYVEKGISAAHVLDSGVVMRGC